MIIPDIAQLLQLPSNVNVGNSLFGGGLLGESELEQPVDINSLFNSILGEVLGVPTTEDAELLDAQPLSKEEQAQADAVAQITQIITVVYEEFSLLSNSNINFENLNSIEALSAAYQELGMDPEEANSRAVRLTVMFLLLDDRISTSDMLASLDAPQELGIQARHQQAFVHIEQTIQAFSSASIGANSDLSSLIRQGDSLLNSPQLLNTPSLLSDAEFKEIISELKGANLDLEAPVKVNNNTDKVGEVISSRISDIFSALSERAAQLPNGEQLGKQLADIAAATQRVSQQVIDDGGLLEANQLQKLPVQEVVIKQPQPQSQPQTSAQAQANVQAQIVDERPLPNIKPARSNATETSAAEVKNSEGIVRNNGTANPTSIRELALAEPPVPTYVVRPAQDGGVEVVNPNTGEVVQISTTSQNSQSSSAPQASENALAQSRGLETAQQARLAQQVRVHVRTLANHGGGQIVVGLNPPELGRIQVRLEIIKGSVKGAITVQRPEVAENIARDMRSLELALQDAGLSLDKDGISIQLENNANGGEQNSKESHNTNNGTSLASKSMQDISAQDVDLDTAAQWVSPDRLLDVKA